MSILNTIYEIRDTRYEKGAALLLTLIVMITLTSVVGAYLGFVQYSTRSTGAQISDSQALYLAEAGLQKAIWNLMRTVVNGGQGEDWTTPGTIENLGEGSYTMVVERWDWALAANNATASVSSSAPGHNPNNAIDDSNDTYWESADKPKPPMYESITITFPYTLTVNKARFVVPAGSDQQRPVEYEWRVSGDDIDLNYTIALAEKKNTLLDRTDDFPTAQTNVNYLQLRVAKTAGTAIGVRIATIEAIGSKITVTGTVDGISREIEETVAVDDASEEAYDQIDWSEI